MQCGNIHLMLEQDTICAVSTPPGEGGIGIIRMSGKNSIMIASTVFKLPNSKRLDMVGTHTIHYGHVIDPASGETIDEALISVMLGPATYTREDIVEINCHGGMMSLWRTMALLTSAGGRQAEPGEFTKRAFLNGRIDLAQAEAVMDIITSKTYLAHRVANEQLLGELSAEISRLRDFLISLIASLEAGIDFPEDDIETLSAKTLADDVSHLIAGVERLLSGYTYGRILRDGFATAIVGKPNVGKSSLLNTLLQQNRAIVSEIPGTTRDVLEEYLNISGFPIKIVDTAGIRHSHDSIERESIRRSLAAIKSADIVLVVLDGSQPLTAEDRQVLDHVVVDKAIAVINKSDLPKRIERLNEPKVQVSLSCITGKGLDDLKSAISDMVKQGTAYASEHTWVVNHRHKITLEQTRENLLKARESVEAGLSPEFVALDLRGALDALGLIIGATYSENILERIFTNFCIGK